MKIKKLVTAGLVSAMAMSMMVSPASAAKKAKATYEPTKAQRYIFDSSKGIWELVETETATYNKKKNQTGYSSSYSKSNQQTSGIYNYSDDEYKKLENTFLSSVKRIATHPHLLHIRKRIN